MANQQVMVPGQTPVAIAVTLGHTIQSTFAEGYSAQADGPYGSRSPGTFQGKTIDVVRVTDFYNFEFVIAGTGGITASWLSGILVQGHSSSVYLWYPISSASFSQAAGESIWQWANTGVRDSTAWQWTTDDTLVRNVYIYL